MFLLAASRPRFWLYLLGPFLVGSAAGWKGMPPLSWMLLFFYCMLPANLFLYGVNDIADKDTDALNTKKGTYEHKLQHKDEATLYRASMGMLITGILLAALLPTPSRWYLLAFLFLGYAYSIPPLRLKARPILDFLSNSLYVIPGFVAYTLLTGQGWIDAKIFIATCLWSWGMHLYSAVPDIVPDKKAGIHTTAVMLGSQKALLLVTALWGVATYFALTISPVLIIFVVYPFLAILTLSSRVSLPVVYTYFPLLNALVGFWVFVYTVCQRFL